LIETRVPTFVWLKWPAKTIQTFITWSRSGTRIVTCHLSPDIPQGRDAVNLTPEIVDCLKDKHYIVGQLQRVIF
jgi:hypothetical protein